MRLAIVLLLAAWTARAIQAQIVSNPVPARIVKRGLAVAIKRISGRAEKRSLISVWTTILAGSQTSRSKVV